MRSRRSSDDPPPVLPAVGTVLGLTAPDAGRRWRCRVEAQAGDQVLVTAPVAASGSDVLFGDGQEVVLRWTTPSGVAHGEGRLVGREHDVVPCRWIHVRRVTRTQRRTAFRAAVRTPVTVVADGRRVIGEVRDVSEVGLRMLMADRMTVKPLTRVRLRFGLKDRDLLATGAVIWVAEEAEGTELGLRFVGLAAEEVDHLRRYVLALQFERRARTAPASHE